MGLYMHVYLHVLNMTDFFFNVVRVHIFLWLMPSIGAMGVALYLVVYLSSIEKKYSKLFNPQMYDPITIELHEKSMDILLW